MEKVTLKKARQYLNNRGVGGYSNISQELLEEMLVEFAQQQVNKLNIPVVSIAKQKVDCKYIPTCMIRRQNEQCKASKSCYEQPT